MSGAELYRLVEEYSALGDHRAGTSVEAATIDWMATQLRRLGLAIETEEYAFDRWLGTSTLTADGEPVNHLPVFYEFTGSVSTSKVHAVSIDPLFGGFPGVLVEPIAAARASGADALVVATEHPDETIVAINRNPEEGSGFPVVLVGDGDFARLAEAELELNLTADLVPTTSVTLLATNAIAGAPLLITTPLTGWFGCAGERGTGIAVSIDVIRELSDLPLLVVATTGHELHFLGARRWLSGADASPAAVLHVGASVAVEDVSEDGSRSLAATRMAMTDVAAQDAAGMTLALAPANLALRADTERWMGEAEVFESIGVPMLSLSGAGRHFHTPLDTPERATSPEALQRAAVAVAAAGRSLYNFAVSPGQE